MPINGEIDISCNDEPVLTLCTIYDNNTPVQISQTSSLASLEAIHDTKTTAHQALFNELKAKNTEQDTLIAQKANTTAIPTKLSQLTNDTNYVTDISGKADVSLSNISNAGVTLIQSYLQNKKSSFCINSGNTVNGQNKTLSFENATLTCSACTITNTDGESKTFSTSATLDCSDYSDGLYYVLKNYNDGTLELKKDISLGKQTDVTWTRPNLTSDGTMGGDSFACAASSCKPNEGYVGAYGAFDNNTTAYLHSWYANATTGWITFYNPIPLNVTNLNVMNYIGSNEGTILSGAILVSNDNTTWTSIKSFTNSNTTTGGTWDISLSDNTGYYKYYRLRADSINFGQVLIQEMRITATQKVNSIIYKENNSIIFKELNSNNSYTTITNQIIIGTVKITSGVISSVYNNEYDKNIWDEIATLPDYQRQISITANTDYTAESNGWICTSSAIIKAICINETFTPTSTGYYFCPMKGN